jgi:RimJ/RimL family protein N-acetyltransferase
MSDLEDLHRIMADPRNIRYVPAEPQQTPAVTRAWIERYGVHWDINDLSYWTVRLRATGAVIGVGGVDRRPEFWNVFYLFDVSHWGHGYATELARAAQHAAAALDPYLPLVAWIHDKNVA